MPGVEEVVDGVFRRSLRLPGGPGVVALGPGVEAELWLEDPADLDDAVARCRALLDLDRDPQVVQAALADGPLVGPLVRERPGLRVPGAADGFELAVRAVLGQQVSLASAATHAGRLVARYGERLPRPVGGVTHLFPSMDTLGAIDESSLAMPRSRSRALVALARARTLDPVELLGLPGIGPWTVEYVRMRALGDPDAFLPTDLGVRHAVARLGGDPSPRAIAALAEAWRPFRAYALQHLWATL